MSYKCSSIRQNAGAKLNSSIDFYSHRTPAGQILELRTPSQFILCQHANEFFAVERSKVQKGEWVLQSRTANDRVSFGKALERRHLVVWPLCGLDQFSSTADFLVSKSVKITAARMMNTTLRIDFTEQFTNPKHVKTGFVDFDTSNSCVAILSKFKWSKETFGYEVAVTVKKTVENRPDGLFCTGITVEAEKLSTRAIFDSESLKYEYNIEPLKPEAYTLAYYSEAAAAMPVAEAYEDRPASRSRFWIGLGIACIALSLLLGWWYRRKRL